MIPQKLQTKGINFVLLEKGGKRPFQQAWQNKLIEYDNTELVVHFQNGGNYGVMGGGQKNLVIVDFDNANIQKELIDKFPKTFTVKTGSGMLHKYFYSDKTESFKIFDEDMNTLIDVQGQGKQVVGPGSIHPNGNKYEVIEDCDIAFIPYSELQAIIKPYDKKAKKIKVEEEKPQEFSHGDFLDYIKSTVKIESVLSEFGVDTSRNPSDCPFHSSKGGKCLGWKDEVAHCFHCEGSWNIFSLVKQMKNFTFRDALIWIVERYGLQKEYQESQRKYFDYLNSQEHNEKARVREQFLEFIGEKPPKISSATEVIVDYILMRNKVYTTKNDEKPEIYIYKDGIYVPQGRSEIKEIMRYILGQYYNSYYYNQVSAKIEASTFIDPNKFFNVCYKDELPVLNGILNIRTRQLSSFTPDKIFFNKSPINYISNARCPNIDSFLSDVLHHPSDKLVFYEMGGFSLLKEYTFEKAFMLVGDGRNGKGKSLELIKRVVGPENTISLPLSALQYENADISQLFGKMINLAGDIGNKDLQDTSMFKGLTGRDTITAKRKFLPAIVFQNYAKFIFACNELPKVYDTSKGFWDRWILLEFPYYFADGLEMAAASSEIKKYWKLRDETIIDRIATPEELSGLMNAFLDGLDRLIENHRFSSTLGTEEVKNTWIRKSNSFMAFCLDYIEVSLKSFISKKQVRTRFSQYIKEHQLKGASDKVIKIVLENQFEASDGRKDLGNVEWDYVWEGIKWKNSLY